MSGSRLNTEIPKSLRTRPKDRRGYPIAYIVVQAKDGTPIFTTNDYAKVQECVRKRLCGLCGKKMKGGMWFIGGKRCFTDYNGAFLDPPSHRECAEYALKVCPYLAAPSYAGRIDDKLPKGVELPAGLRIVVEDRMSEARPAVFGLGHTRDYDSVPASNPGTSYYIARGWEHIEYWARGRKLPDGDLTK